MAKIDLRLQETEAVVAEMAARLYAGYVSAGWLREDEDPEPYMDRAIREAIRMAQKTDATVTSDGELA